MRRWYSRVPSIVENAGQLVDNAEECARACTEGERERNGLSNSYLSGAAYINWQISFLLHLFRHGRMLKNVMTATALVCLA